MEKEEENRKKGFTEEFEVSRPYLSVKRTETFKIKGMVKSVCITRNHEASMSMCVCVCVCVYIYIYVCVCVCVCVCL